MGGSERSDEQSVPRPSGETALFRGVIDSSPDPILTKDRDLRAIFCNEAFARLCGKRSEELSGMREEETGWVAEVDLVDTGEGSRGYEEADHEALAGKTIFIPSKRYRIDGGLRFFDVTRSPVLDASGAVVAVLCAWHDVTTFHTAVEELREAAERYRAMSEHSHEWEVWQDANGRILYMSPSFFRITGYPIPAFLADPDHIRTIVHPGDRDAYNAHRDRTLTDYASQTERKLVFRIVHRDGGVRWIEHYCKSVFRADGTFFGRRASNRDITETVLAEEKLKASELKFRVVFENSPLGKSITDIDGGLHVNQAFSAITGYELKELESMTWREITYPDDIPITERAIEPLLSGRDTVASFEKRYVHKSGRVVWAAVITTLQRDANGTPLFYITSINDITEQKRTEEALRQKRLVFDASNAGNSTADLNGHITEANGEFLRLWGYDGKQGVVGKPARAFFRDGTEAAAVLSALNRDGKWAGTFTALRRDGSTFHAHGIATVLRSPDGELIGYQASIIEVNEQ